MTEVQVWRGVAIIALLGWATTALSTFGEAALAPDPPTLVARPATLEPTPVPARALVTSDRVLVSARVDDPPVDLQALREQVRAEVEAELADERAQRHDARERRRLIRMLDDVSEFAVEHELDEDTLGDLEAAVVAMHDRMSALGPPPGGPPDGPRGDGPPPEVEDAMRQSFEQLDRSVRDAIGDELAEAFHEWMRPGPPPR